MSATPHRGGAAAFTVITHHGLVSQISAFQVGLPGVVAPLVHRFEAEGWMHRATRAVYVRNADTAIATKVPVACVVSEVSGRIWPPRQWHERCALEASAAYDSGEDGFPMLRLLIDSLTSTRSQRGREHVYRRICDAAAAVGRVEVLQWMHTSRSAFTASVRSSCARAAIRHGQQSVLEWIEATFGAEALRRAVTRDGYRRVDVNDAVKRGHGHVVLWLEARGTHPFAYGAALNSLIERSDVPTLRLLNAGQHQMIHAANHALVAHAVAHNRPEPLSYFVRECGIRATVRTLEHALELNHDAAAVCLAENHQMLQRDAYSRDVLPTHVLERIRSYGIVGDSASHRAVQMLLPMYPRAAVAAAVIKFTSQKIFTHCPRFLELASDAFTELTGQPLPQEVTAYVRRVTTETLGPLATVASRRWTYVRASFEAEIDRHIQVATRDDIHDAVFALLFVVQPDEADFLLERDATRPEPGCDAPFLALCAAIFAQVPFSDSMKAIISRAQVRQAIREEYQ